MTTERKKPNEAIVEAGEPLVIPVDTERREPSDEKRQFCDAELTELLDAEPVLCLRLKEALQSGRWAVTIHVKVKDAPPNDLESHEIHKGFPIVDLPSAMQGLCRAMLDAESVRLEGEKARILDSRAWR